MIEWVRVEPLPGLLPDRDAGRRRRRRPAQPLARARHRLHRRPPVPGDGVAPLLRGGRGDHGRLRRPPPLGQAPLPDRRDPGAALPALGGVPGAPATSSTPTASSPTSTPSASSAPDSPWRRSEEGLGPRRGRSGPRRRSRRPRPGGGRRSARRARRPWRGAGRRGRRPRGRAAGGAEQRRLHLAGALLGVELQARRAARARAGAPGRRCPRRGSRRRARSRPPGAGLRTIGSAKPAAGVRREAAVVVEEGGRVEARAGGRPRSPRPRRAVSSRLPVPPPLTISQLGELADRGDDRRPPLGQLGGRAPLHEADRGAAQAPARRLVADAGDLALVGHQRAELDLRPALDLARQRHRLLDRVDRRALRRRP